MMQKMFGGIYVNSTFGSLNNVGYYSSFPMMSVIAIISIRYPQKSSLLYTRRNIVIMIIICLVYGIIYGIINLQHCCYFVFIPDIYSFSWDIERNGSYILSYVELSKCVVTCVICQSLNLLSLNVMRKNRKKVASSVAEISNYEREKSEKKLICFLLLLYF